MQDFEGTRVLITGAASGFGRLLAERLAGFGARLVLGDLDLERLMVVADALDVPVEALGCDVSRETDAKALCARAQACFGGLDIAVNNAGIMGEMTGFLDTCEADLDRLIAVNTKGVFFGMQQQIPLLLAEGGGAILNVASVAGIGAAPKLGAYAAAKHAVVGLTRTAAVEFARKGVRINAICPFYSPTPMVQDGVDDVRMNLLQSAAPMKRLAEPAEVVEAMIMLIHPGNSYMTGQAVAVDGGVTAL